MKIKVVELFAGVGGFRLGLEDKKAFLFVWSNQWEPLSSLQHASLVYKKNFGNDNHINIDINKINVKDIPDHDLLVGGFPCQDYSVATTLKNSKGLEGEKGTLWWSIHKILKQKKNKKPKYLFLENVNRLLSSPYHKKGRDFAIILKSLSRLGYAVEWRVINAADYGMPQRRRRIYILAYHKSTKIYCRISKMKDKTNWIIKNGVLANSFKIETKQKKYKKIFLKDLLEKINSNDKNNKKSFFLNTGLFIKNTIYTIKTIPYYNGHKAILKDFLQKDVKDEFFVSEKDIEKWKYLKGLKKIKRVSKTGHEYIYSEGSMTFPDSLDKPARTIITGEGGKSPSRCKHIIKVGNRYRRLTPLELERLNMFPDNFTYLEGISDSRRAFLMGNALVVGVIKKIGKELYKQILK